MATVNGIAADPASIQPIVMTREQFNQLGQLIANNHADTRTFQKLQHAAAGIDRCDGVVPEHVRSWIRALDGWQCEDVDESFVLDLAKATATGDLLDEIRARVNDETDGGLHAVDDWTGLRAHIVDHFLSACEDVKLQTQLETTKQRVGETTPAYIRRFRTDANRAYGIHVRAPTEENRVVASFLRGLADRQFAERLYRTGRVATLSNAIQVALEKEAERERMEQMLRSRGEEPMEVSPVDATDKLLGVMTTMQHRLEQVSSRLAKMEARGATPPKTKPIQDPPKRRQQQDGQGDKRRPRYRWDEQGRPICNRCARPGHISRECPNRKGTSTPQMGGR